MDTVGVYPTHTYMHMSNYTSADLYSDTSGIPKPIRGHRYIFHLYFPHLSPPLLYNCCEMLCFVLYSLNNMESPVIILYKLEISFPI